MLRVARILFLFFRSQTPDFLRRLKCNSSTHRAFCMRKISNCVSSGFAAPATVNWKVHDTRCRRIQHVCIICKALTLFTVHTISSIHRDALASYCHKCRDSRYGFRCWNSIYRQSSAIRKTVAPVPAASPLLATGARTAEIATSAIPWMRHQRLEMAAAVVAITSQTKNATECYASGMVRCVKCPFAMIWIGKINFHFQTKRSESKSIQSIVTIFTANATASWLQNMARI